MTNKHWLQKYQELIWCQAIVLFDDDPTQFTMQTGLILGLRPANERRRYFVTSLIGWA